MDLRVVGLMEARGRLLITPSLQYSITPLFGEWSPKLVSHQRLLLFREALICLSYSGMNMVVPAGNAPASSGYQPDALLLSYETVVNCASRRAGSPGGTPGSTAV